MDPGPRGYAHPGHSRGRQSFSRMTPGKGRSVPESVGRVVLDLVAAGVPLAANAAGDGEPLDRVRLVDLVHGPDHLADEQPRIGLVGIETPRERPLLGRRDRPVGHSPTVP